MAFFHNAPTIIDHKNYIDRSGITDRSRRKDLYDFIKHLIDIGAYENIHEIYFCQSPYNDQSQSKVIAFKDPARDGIITGTLLNWDESGIETDATCGWESPFGYEDPGILSMFKMTSDSFTTTSDNPIAIWAKSFSGENINVSNNSFVRWGTTGTGSPLRIYQSYYDNNPAISGASRMRHGMQILDYNVYMKNKFAFIGYSYPPPNTESEDAYNPIGGIVRTTNSVLERYQVIQEDVPDLNSSGSDSTYSHLLFTSQSSNNTATAYHTFHIFWKQHAQNYATNGIYESIMDKAAQTISKNLENP